MFFPCNIYIYIYIFFFLDCNYETKFCTFVLDCISNVILVNFNSSIAMYSSIHLVFLFFQLNKWRLHCKFLDLRRIITLVEPSPSLERQ